MTPHTPYVDMHTDDGKSTKSTNYKLSYLP